MPIHIYIIDDHPIINQGLTEVLNSGNYGVKVIGSCINCEDAIDEIVDKIPDVVILDLVMPNMNGITCCRLLKQKLPTTKVIGYTGELDTSLLLEVWLEKVDAILLKSCGIQELISTIKSVMKNNRIIGKEVPEFFGSISSKDNSKINLTRTETRILKHLGEGKTRKEVSEIMNRSIDTINFHCRNIFNKFGDNRIHVVLKEAKKSRYI